MQISLFDGSQEFKIDKPIRLIELFAGIGSQAKALKNLGVDFEHYRICEFDKYAVASYNAVHGTNFETSDITKITAKDLGIVDTDKYCYIMTYSFPCQDLSNAGLGKGMAKGSGTRSGLLWEVERLLDECENLPQVLLMENVPQVIGQNNIQHFAKWIEKLEQLGYKNKWQVLNAKDYGIPQNRERCFMVSILGDYYYDFPKTIPLTLRLKDVLEKKVDKKYYLSEKTIKYFIKHTQESIEKCNGFRFEPTEGNVIAKSVLTKNGSRPCDNFIKENAYRFYEQAFETVEKNDCENGGTIDAFNKKVNKSGYSPTVTTRPDGFKPAILVYDGYNQSIRKDSTTVGTLTRNCGADLKRNRQGIIENCDVRLFQYGHGYLPPGEINSDVFPTVRESNTARYNNAILQNGDVRVRKLTPKECWRLMGFEDKDIDNAIAIGMSNAQLYKQAGNSIVVNVLMAIFKEML